TTTFLWQGSSHGGGNWVDPLLGHNIGATYNPTGLDEGLLLRLTVSLTNSGGTTTTTQSFGIVQEDPNETALVTLSGNAVEGQTVIAAVNEPDAPTTGILYTFQTSPDGVNWTTVQSLTDVNTYTTVEGTEGQ